VIEFSRNNLNLLDANSTEFNPDTSAPVIALIKEWMNKDGSLESRDEDSDLGGSMRLCAQECIITNKTLARRVYQKSSVFERHRHRYEFNINFKEDLEQQGLIFSGHSKDGLVEIIELADHPWFFACQFHPEFTSSPRKGHPLFESFIQASVEYRRTKKE
jgi:CTP synthase